MDREQRIQAIEQINQEKDNIIQEFEQSIQLL